MEASVSRVVILGLDGGTWSVLRSAFDRGWMPSLARLWSRSAWGGITSTDPMITPVAWTSILTGCTPRAHGIHEFDRIDEDRLRLLPNDASRIQVPSLWDQLGTMGLGVISLNVPMTYPAPPVGIIVGGVDSPDRNKAFHRCPEFGARLARELPAFSHKIVCKRRPETIDELRAMTARCRAGFLSKSRAARLADAQLGGDWAAMMVHFHDLDSLQHRLWNELDLSNSESSEGPPRVGPAWRDEVAGCLRALDDAVGELIEFASTRDAAVVVVSDHGFTACRAVVNVNALLRQGGYQSSQRTGDHAGRILARVSERVGRWCNRRLSGHKTRRNARPIAARVTCDLTRSAAFAPYGQLSACVMLNQRQFPRGESGRRLAAEIAEFLAGARDPDTNDALFRDSYVTADRLELDPWREGLPEVMAHSADGYQAQAKWQLGNGWIQPDPNLPGTHALEGVIAVHAPKIEAGRHGRSSLPDLAPTVLSLLGLPRPHWMEGRAIPWVLGRAGRAGEPTTSSALATARLAATGSQRSLSTPTPTSMQKQEVDDHG